MFRLSAPFAAQSQSPLLVPTALRAFGKSAKDHPMAGRFKPRSILNFDSKNCYLLYKSDFSRPARAKLHSHPKTTSSLLTLFSITGVVLSLTYAFRLMSVDPWSYKFRMFSSLVLASVFLKTFRRAYTMQQVIKTINLLPDGKTLEISCHFPFGFTATKAPINQLKFLRSDDLARKLRQEEVFVDMRCTPMIYKEQHYNLFIEGTIYDRDVFKAVTEG